MSDNKTWTCKGPNGDHEVTHDQHTHQLAKKVGGIWVPDDSETVCSACFDCCPI